MFRLVDKHVASTSRREFNERLKSHFVESMKTKLPEESAVGFNGTAITISMHQPGSLHNAIDWISLMNFHSSGPTSDFTESGLEGIQNQAIASFRESLVKSLKKAHSDSARAHP